MVINEALFSSERDDWETPELLFQKLNEEFNFTIDVCANEINAKCILYYDVITNGLIQDWSRDICWMNPPYGKVIGDWVKKAYEESLCGATVVCLLPARTDTRWFHDYIYHKAEIRFIRGRLKFVGADNCAPFPSMIIIFKGG